MLEIKKILFPVDFTQNSSKLLPYVLSISDKYDSTIYLLHVVEDLSKWGSGFHIPQLYLKQYQDAALKGAEKSMDKVCDEQLKSCPNFQRIIVSGDPAQEALKTIEDEGIDLVTMGTHGRKGLEHTIFGSVAENVVKKSSAPVLVINPYKLKGI
ncbi:MAG: universal stress protein [Deltaproteobacteria bacterium]|nr:universal stress protein [Deltaproteobacteria bacterium]